MMNNERPDDKNFCIGVTTSSGEKTFYMFDETCALNSFSDEYINSYFETQHLRQYDNTGIRRQVQCYTLDQVVEKYCGGMIPDLLDLDIEGYDAAVIKSYQFTTERPKIICVESHEDEMNSYLRNKGYKLYFSTPHNEIFVDLSVFKWI